MWSRNRTNLLVWTQLIVVFSFLADIPHYANKESTHRALYYFMMTVGNIALVAAVVTTVDLLAAWYDISTLGAVMFSIYGLSRTAAALALQDVEFTRALAFIQQRAVLQATDNLKDVRLRL